MFDSSIKVSRNINLFGEQFALLIKTFYGSVTIITAIHRQQLQRRLGGVRFVHQGVETEVGRLAKGMSEKCAAAHVPFDGLKCLVICPKGIPDSETERAEILSDHIGKVVEYDDKVIFGPDMGSPETVLDRVADNANLLNHVTGLTARFGGLEIDRNGFTASGLFYAIEMVLSERRLNLSSAIVQGFGAVGALTAKLLAENHIMIRGISAKHGMLISTKDLDMHFLFELWQQKGDHALETYAKSRSDKVRFKPYPDKLLDLSADIFLPAARTSVLAMPEELKEVRQENPSVRDATHFLKKTGVRMVAEGANHPLTEKAELFLEKNGVIILPDIIVNCGGMIGCWYEWQHRSALMASQENYQNGLTECKKYIQKVMRINVTELLKSKEKTRVAAKIIISKNLTTLRKEMNK